MAKASRRKGKYKKERRKLRGKNHEIFTAINEFNEFKKDPIKLPWGFGVLGFWGFGFRV